MLTNVHTYFLLSAVSTHFFVVRVKYARYATHACCWQKHVVVTSKCLSANAAGSFKTRNCECRGKYRWLPMEAADKAPPSRKTRTAAYFLALARLGFVLEERNTRVCARSAVYDLEIRSASASLCPLLATFVVPSGATLSA